MKRIFYLLLFISTLGNAQVFSPIGNAKATRLKIATTPTITGATKGLVKDNNGLVSEQVFPSSIDSTASHYKGEYDGTLGTLFFAAAKNGDYYKIIDNTTFVQDGNGLQANVPINNFVHYDGFNQKWQIFDWLGVNNATPTLQTVLDTGKEWVDSGGLDRFTIKDINGWNQSSLYQGTYNAGSSMFQTNNSYSLSAFNNTVGVFSDVKVETQKIVIGNNNYGPYSGLRIVGDEGVIFESGTSNDGTQVSLKSTNITDSRILQFPDSSGTIALLSDITGGATNISYVPSTRNVVSSTGTGFVFPLADITNSGLMSNIDKSKLDNLPASVNNLVPYTGATQNLDLGVRDLNVDAISLNSAIATGYINCDVLNVATNIDATGIITGSNVLSTNVTDIASKLSKSSNLLDLDNVSTARTNLGLGSLATQSGTFSGTSNGTNTGDNATNTNYENDYRLANFVAGTNYLAPNGNASALTGFPILNQNTTGTAGTITGNITESQVTNLVTDLAGKQVTLISGTNIKTINGISVLGSGDLLTQTTFTLSSASTSTVVARANVTGMVFNVVSGKKYKIELIGDYQTAGANTGGSIGFILPTGVGTIKGSVTMSISQSTVATDLTTTIRTINAGNLTAGSFITSTGVSLINSPHYFDGNLVFDCTTSGTFQLQWATEVAGSSAQMNAGTVMIVTPLN